MTGAFKLKTREGIFEPFQPLSNLLKEFDHLRERLEFEMGGLLIDAIQPAFRSFATFKIGLKFGLTECYDPVC